MTRAHGPRRSVLALAGLLALGWLLEAAWASGFEYASEKRQVKVANLLVQSARARTGPGNDPSRINLENPDPHIFWILERSPWKPATWEFINPLAPSVVTQEILDRWDFRYAAGGTDPNFGTPGSRVVNLGDPLPKWSGAYWEVLLCEENFQALLQYDLLLITNHSITAFTTAERDLLRRLVDAGAIILVDDCGGMRVTHASDEGQIPTSDFNSILGGDDDAPPPSGDGLLDTDSAYFNTSYFSRWGAGRDTEIALPTSAEGFFTPLQFASDGGASGYARIAERYNPLITSPYWLTQTELNEIGDKGISQYRISHYDENVLYPVILNSAYADPGMTDSAVDPDANRPYGQPHISMGYYGEGILIATAGDIGCAINDDVTGGPMFSINNQRNSGYWCGIDFSSPDTDPRPIGSVKFVVNAVSLAAKYRGGFGGPRQQGSVTTHIPNSLNPAAEADVVSDETQTGLQWAGFAGQSAGHSAASTANNVVYVMVPAAGGNTHYLVALDGMTGRDLDGNGSVDDGLRGIPAPPELVGFAPPALDVLWFETLAASGSGDDAEPMSTSPVIGKAAYQVGGRWQSTDAVFIAVNRSLYAFEALPLNGTRIANTARPLTGWSTMPETVVGSGAERVTGLTYCRGMLYAEVGEPDSGSSVRIEIRAANDGVEQDTIEVPGLLGSAADAASGPALAIVPDRWNGCQDETLYLPVSPDTNVRAQVYAIVLRTWNERMRPVGRPTTGTDAAGASVSGVYPNWRIRDFARFRSSADEPVVYVNGVLVDPDEYIVVADPAAPSPDPDIPGDGSDYQQIQFNRDLAAAGIPRCTTEGPPADAQVLATYDHLVPDQSTFPMTQAQAGSIKWRYILTKRSVGPSSGTTPYLPSYTVPEAGEFVPTRVAVDAEGNVGIACPLSGPSDPDDDEPTVCDTFHLIRDLGYPTDLVDRGPLGDEPETTDAWAATPTVWNGDEKDQVGSLVFWQESNRPLMGYALQLFDSDAASAPGRQTGLAMGSGLGVVRTSLPAPYYDSADWLSGYSTVDLRASMSVTLGRGDGRARSAPVLSGAWTVDDDPTDPALGLAPYGVRVYDAWTGTRIEYSILPQPAPAANEPPAPEIPNLWWVEPGTSTIHFKHSDLAGRKLLVTVCDNSGTADTWYHEYLQVPPIVVGQFPAMTAKVGPGALDRPSYSGAEPCPTGAAPTADRLAFERSVGGWTGAPAWERWVTPLAVDWDHGIASFWPAQALGALTCTTALGGPAYNFDTVFSGPDPRAQSSAPPLIVGDKYLAHGWVWANGAATPQHGLLTMDLDPRDSSEQDPANEPWTGSAPPWWGGSSPGAPWPTFHGRDEGQGDGYALYWSGSLGVPVASIENLACDVLGVALGGAAPPPSTAGSTSRAAPVVTSDGKSALTSVLSTTGTAVSLQYQWWNSAETVIGCQNRLLVVDAGRNVVRDIPSNGISEVLGNMALPSGADWRVEAQQSTFRGISRPTVVRDLAYAGKPGRYYLCDSGNDQVIEVDKTGAISVRISNRLRPPFGGGNPWINTAFYDVPGWYADLPSGAPTTISAPHDAYRWESTQDINGDDIDDWRFEFDWIADSGNYRVLGLLRQIPADPTVSTPLADQHHLIFSSDAHQAVLDPTGQRVERGPALQYVTAWPTRSRLSSVRWAIANGVTPPAGPPFVDTDNTNFAGIVAAINNVALSTVPGDARPYPRNLGPGASVAMVGRLSDSDGNGSLDAIDDQIEWAFSEIYIRNTAPTGQPALMPFRKLKKIHYLDVYGPTMAAPFGICYYITIADEDGIYPVTYYPAVGPFASGAPFAGRAILALRPEQRPGFQIGPDGFGATWWFDAQEYATTMGSLRRGANPDIGTPGAERTPVWSTFGTPAYPIDYTGSCALDIDPSLATSNLLQDRTFSFFRPVFVERQNDGTFLVTNGHERKGEVLQIDPFAVDPLGPLPSASPLGLYDTDYTTVLSWILPDPVAYRTDESGNTPEIGRETFSLGQPWCASRRTDF